MKANRLSAKPRMTYHYAGRDHRLTGPEGAKWFASCSPDRNTNDDF